MRLSRTALVVAMVLAAAASGMGAGLHFFLKHHDSRLASTEEAEAEFLKVRARFGNQQPLLDMGERRPLEQRGASETVAPLREFHTVIFDTRGKRRLVHMAVPYWFARCFARHGGEFRWLGELTFLDDTEFDSEAIQLSLDRVEHHGPGLIAEYRHTGRGWFITWVE